LHERYTATKTRDIIGRRILAAGRSMRRAGNLPGQGLMLQEVSPYGITEEKQDSALHNDSTPVKIMPLLPTVKSYRKGTRPSGKERIMQL
jgi:hypothetical protein